MTPWTVAYQAPLSMEFSRQGYWSGLPFPAPGYLPSPGIEPRSPALQASSLPSEPPAVGQSGVGSPVSHHLCPLPDGFLSASLLFFSLFQPALEPVFGFFGGSWGAPEGI